MDNSHVVGTVVSIGCSTRQAIHVVLHMHYVVVFITCQVTVRIAPQAPPAARRAGLVTNPKGGVLNLAKLLPLPA